MNKEWSELNKSVQLLMKRKETYSEGIKTLLHLREDLMDVILSFKDELKREEFNAIPFINADGYHSKTIAYSLWHIFRIEDIVANTLIRNDEQIFFTGNYKDRISSPIITTGNELAKEQIADFSEKLDIDELYLYISEVRDSTDDILKDLPFEALKDKISDEQKKRLRKLNVVSDDEKAAWLVDYWCGKSVLGLIKMPFSRHWIMHIEASLRIKEKIMKNRK